MTVREDTCGVHVLCHLCGTHITDVAYRAHAAGYESADGRHYCAWCEPGCDECGATLDDGPLYVAHDLTPDDQPDRHRCAVCSQQRIRSELAVLACLDQSEPVRRFVSATTPPTTLSADDGREAASTSAV